MIKAWFFCRFERTCSGEDVSQEACYLKCLLLCGAAGYTAAGKGLVCPPRHSGSILRADMPCSRNRHS
jgi:hypothetical protein